MVALQICQGLCEQTSSCARCALVASPDLCVANGNCTHDVERVDHVEGQLHIVCVVLFSMSVFNYGLSNLYDI